MYLIDCDHKFSLGNSREAVYTLFYAHKYILFCFKTFRKYKRMCKNEFVNLVCVPVR